MNIPFLFLLLEYIENGKDKFPSNGTESKRTSHFNRSEVDQMNRRWTSFSALPGPFEELEQSEIHPHPQHNQIDSPGTQQ